LQEQLAVMCARLNSMSPLATLGRGYAIVNDLHTREIIRDVNSLSLGQKLETKIAIGSFVSVVEKIKS